MPKRNHKGEVQKHAEAAMVGTDDEPQAQSTDGSKAMTATQSTIFLEEKPILCEHRGNHDETALIFTHGVGGGIESPVMQQFAEGFAALSKLTMFQGNMNLRSRIKAFKHVIDHTVSEAPLAIGGRSMGARAAVFTALELDWKKTALVLVSYPLTAGKDGATREPERREQILLDLDGETDVLFIIGSSDAQCDLAQLRQLRRKMRARSWLAVVDGANHGMEIKPASQTPALRQKTGMIAAKWLTDRDHSTTFCEVRLEAGSEDIRCTDWALEDEDDAEVEQQPVKKRRQ